MVYQALKAPPPIIVPSGPRGDHVSDLKEPDPAESSHHFIKN